MDKRWSKTEISHLKRNATQSLEELAQRFHTDTDTVRRKLEELDLLPGGGSAGSQDAVVERYEEALRLLYEKKWAEAGKVFEAIIDTPDHPQVTDRARQFLEVCQQRSAGDGESADPYLEAVFAKNQGDLDSARELCQKHGSKDDDGRYTYLLASIEALGGEAEEALSLLENAIRLEPKHRVYAFHDPDFASIREHEGFHGLISAGA